MDLEFSVVIPALNVEATLAQQLEALASQHEPPAFEVLVADNGSTDSTVAVAQGFRADLRLRVVDASLGSGINVARNAGAAVARGRALAFCDGDDVVSAGWLRALSRALERGALAGGPLDYKQLNNRIPTWLEQQHKADALPRPFGYLSHPFGGNSACLRRVWTELGGFDESYRGGGDEVAFFWRAQLAGWDLVYFPDAVVYVRTPTDLGGAWRRWHMHARSHAHLAAEFDDFRSRNRRTRRALRDWAWLLWRLPKRHDPRYQELWFRRSALRTGRLVGSVRYRTLFL